MSRATSSNRQTVETVPPRFIHTERRLSFEKRLETIEEESESCYSKCNSEKPHASELSFKVDYTKPLASAMTG
ncbi:unnamed protein product [Ilex paraguariensis]|uniref:Uncharacterized protein n=1 Tax=Ilex paraguariensis TaxID=185542 RepID=A0ABC8QZ15_9AQUA